MSFRNTLVPIDITLQHLLENPAAALHCKNRELLSELISEEIHQLGEIHSGRIDHLGEQPGINPLHYIAIGILLDECHVHFALILVEGTVLDDVSENVGKVHEVVADFVKSQFAQAVLVNRTTTTMTLSQRLQRTRRTLPMVRSSGME